MGKTLTINSISNALRLFTYLAIAFFITPFLVHTLGDSIYGIWILIISICGYMGMLDLGVSSAVVRYVSKYNAEKKVQQLNSVVNSSLAVFLGAGLIGFAIILVVRQWGFTLFSISVDHYAIVKLLLVIMGLNIALFLPGSVFQSILAGFQLYYLTNSVGILLMILKNLAIFIILSRGYGVIHLALITLSFNIIEYILLVLVISLKRLPIKFGFQFLSLESFKEIFSYSYKTFIIMIAGYISMYTDSLVIGIFLTTAWITFFNIPERLVRYLRDLMWSLTSVFTPTFSDLEAKGKSEEIASLVLRSTKYVCIITFPIAFSFLVVGVPFIQRWMGNIYAIRGKWVLYIFTFSFLVSCLTPFTGRLFMGIGKHGIIAIVGAVQAVLNVVLSIILVQKMGIAGVALGTLIAFTFFNLYFLVYTCRFLNISTIYFLRQSIAPPLVSTLIYTLILYGLTLKLYPISYAHLILEVGVSLIAYLISLPFICLSRDEKSKLLKLLRDLTYFKKSRVVRRTSFPNKQKRI